MKSYAASLFLRSLLMLVFVLSLSAQIHATQNEERLLKYHAFPNPPVEIFNLQVDGKPIEFNREFSAGEEWAKGLTFDIKNISGKAIIYLETDLYIPPAKKDGSGGIALMYYHGINIMMPNAKPGNIRIAPGEIVHARFLEKWYEPFQRMQNHIGRERILELGFRVERVIFEDEMMWSVGSYFRRNPENPTSWSVVGREHLIRKPSASPVKSRKITETATAMIGEQPEAPVLLSLNNIFANEPTRPQIGFDYENTSPKTIASVGIKYEIQREKDSLNGLVYETPIKNTLKPGQWTGASFNPPVGASPYKGIVLSVAFVKFADESIWNTEGFDSTHACEGYRAGQEATRSQFAELVQKESPENVIKAAKGTEINVPAGHSLDWANGYRMGARYVMFCVLRALSKKDAAMMSISEELKKPSACPLQ